MKGGKRFRLAAFAGFLATIMGIAVGTQAATVAYWDFENLSGAPGSDGQLIPHPSGDPVVFDAVLDDGSPNGNDLSCKINNASSLSSLVDLVNQTGSELSVHRLGDDAFQAEGDLEVGGTPVGGSMAQWTIEASVYFTSVSGWQTMVGKDGQGVGGDGNAAALYLQKRGDNSGFRVNWCDVAGNRYIVDSSTIAEPDRWYRVVALSDGSSCKIYVDGKLETETLIASTNTALTALQTLKTSNNGTPYTWSVGRGMYANGHGDLVQGYLDDVRISDTALSTNEFLFNPGLVVDVVTARDLYPKGSGTHPQPVISASLIDGAYPLTTSSVQMSINGEAPFEPNVDPGGTGTNLVSYATTSPYAAGATNEVQLTYQDTGGKQYTNNWTFITASYKTLPAEYGYDLSLTGSGVRGFLYRDVSHSESNALSASVRQAILNQLAFKVADAVDQSVDEYLFHPDGYFHFPDDDAAVNVVNFNVDPDNSTHGNFYADATPPLDVAESIFYGIDSSIPYDLADETVAFLELQPGVYGIGVNSDDSHTFYMGPQPRDVNAEVVSERMGYSAADYVVYFNIAQAGLYPFRLIHGQAGGGGGVELFTIGADGKRHLVNDDVHSGSIHAWRVVPPTMPPAITYIDPVSGSSVYYTDPFNVEMVPGGAAIDDLAFELWVNGQQSSDFDVAYNASFEVSGITYTGEMVPGDANEFTVVYGMTGSAERWTNSFFYRASNLPDITVVSNAPSGTGASASPTLFAAVEDGENDTVDPGSIELSLDGVPLSPLVVNKVGTTTTVSYAVSGPLDSGTVYTGQLVVASMNGVLGAITNEWTFKVAATTTDLLWNINIAAGESVSDGVVALAPSAGDNLWNNVSGINGTNTFNGMKDANTGTGTTIDFRTSGSHAWGTKLDAGGTPIDLQMFRGWCGANAPMDMVFLFAGLNTDDAYDIYLYSSWGWTENTVNYALIEGYADVTTGSITEQRAGILNVGSEDYSQLVYGDNYIIFTNVSPSASGVIRFTGKCSDGILSGIQVLQKPGAGAVPPFYIVNMEPSGAGVSETPTMKVDFVDVGAGLDSTSVRLSLNGVELDPNDYFVDTSAAPTTSVSYVVLDPLDAATVYTGMVVAAGSGGGTPVTNEWTFKVAGTTQVGDWNIVDDFEFYEAGEVRNVASPPWIGDTSGANIQEDTAVTNKWLASGSVTSQARGAWREVPSIADGTTATYYFQIKSPDSTPNCYWGLMDTTPASTNFDNEASCGPQVRLVYTNGLMTLAAMDEDVQVDFATITNDHWYGIWLVVDNAAGATSDTYDVFYRDLGTDDLPNGSFLDEGFAGASDLGFRNGGTANALTTFIQESLGAGQNANSQLMDNLAYSDVATGGPVPTGIYVVSNAPTGVISDTMPEVAVWVADANSTLDESSIELYLNDEQLAHMVVSDTTTKIFYAVSEPLKGEYTARLVADDTDPATATLTNEWSFEVPGEYGRGVYIWSNAPTAGADDIYQLSSSLTDGGNVAGGDDFYTYVAGDRGTQGQLFTTASSNAYELTSVWVQSSPVGGGGWSLREGMEFTLRIVDPAADTNNFVLHKEVLVVSNSLVKAGQWLEFRLAYPYTLNGNTQYGFDITSYSPYFELAGQRFYGDLLTGGSAYTTGDRDTREAMELGTVLSAEQDRVFLLELTPAGGEPGEGPVIILTASGGVIQLAWPEGAGSFGVQTNQDLVNGAWATDASLTPDVMNGTNMVTPSTDAPNMNYRLIQQ